MRKLCVMTMVLILLGILVPGCGNNDSEPSRKLNYPEAKLLNSEIGERWIELIEKENKTEEEMRLLDSISLIGIYEDNNVIVTLSNDDKETIRLFKELILEGIENADTVLFDKGDRPEPASEE